MRTFAIGDIHGAAAALEQCLERSGFNRAEDQLINLGDVCDGWKYVYEAVEILLTIKNRIDILGNHDEWFKRWLIGKSHPDAWIQGGNGTYRSYFKNCRQDDSAWESLLPEHLPGTHWRFFMQMLLFYHDTKRDMFFVHGGFDRFKSIEENFNDDPTNFYWDRDLWDRAKSCKGDQKLQTVDDFDTIFIGHTALRNPVPHFSGGVWNLDTGAGWSGKLTIMDVDTKEYWQSDFVPTLYIDDFKSR